MMVRLLLVSLFYFCLMFLLSCFYCFLMVFLFMIVILLIGKGGEVVLFCLGLILFGVL